MKRDDGPTTSGARSRLIPILLGLLFMGGFALGSFGVVHFEFRAAYASESVETGGRWTWIGVATVCTTATLFLLLTAGRAQDADGAFRVPTWAFIGPFLSSFLGLLIVFGLVLVWAITATGSPSGVFEWKAFFDAFATIAAMPSTICILSLKIAFTRNVRRRPGRRLTSILTACAIGILLVARVIAGAQ